MSAAAPRAFVTGATGLLGSNLVAELRRRGWTVRALARDVPRATRLLGAAGDGLELCPGDLADVAAFGPALAGVDAVFHAGAYFRESYRGGSHWERLRAINVDGTRALVDAAYAYGVRTFLHVSSIGTLVARTCDGRPVDASMRRDAATTRNEYFRSKILADQVVEDALAAHDDLWAAFVLPGFMNGPGDAGPTAAGQMILDYAAGALPGVVDAWLSYVDARDVADACIAAVERAPRGARYVVAGRRARIGDAYRILERLTGIAAPRRRLPMALLGAVAAVNELWARVSGRPVLIGLAMFRTLREEGPYNLYDSSRAEHELGVRFRPIDVKLADALRWLADHDMLPRGSARGMRYTSAPCPPSSSPAETPASASNAFARSRSRVAGS